MLKEYTDQLPLITVLRDITPEEVIPIAEVLTQAGLVIMEVTLNSPQPYESIEKLSQQFGKGYLVGAGTVLAAEEVEHVKQAGGRLIVSPHTDVELIRAAKEKNMLVIPGCCTPSDVFSAIQAGADGIKLFPAEMIPPAAVKALRAVVPSNVIVFAVGGIHSGNMLDYLQCGANGFGIGSSLYKSGKSPAVIADDAKSMVDAFYEARNRLTNKVI